MDEILVLNNGRLVERGTQAELLQKNGLYRRLWDLQNQILAPAKGIFSTPVSQI
jgi:ABC-type multidrug transport system fused ATPase/permease subunit